MYAINITASIKPLAPFESVCVCECDCDEVQLKCITNLNDSELRGFTDLAQLDDIRRSLSK